MVQQTSLDVYYTQVLPNLNRRQAQVYEVLKFAPYWITDFTNMEVAQYLGWSINRVTPRILELRNMGLLVYSQTRKCRVTFNTAMAWRLA